MQRVDVICVSGELILVQLNSLSVCCGWDGPRRLHVSP